MKATAPARRGNWLEARKGERRLSVHRCLVSSLCSIVLQLELDHERRPAARRHGEITPREVEVAHWMAAGKTDGQIAQIFQRSMSTIGKHAQHLYVKLGVESRVGAAQWYERTFGSQ